MDTTALRQGVPSNAAPLERLSALSLSGDDSLTSGASDAGALTGAYQPSLDSCSRPDESSCDDGDVPIDSSIPSTPRSDIEDCGGASSADELATSAGMLASSAMEHAGGSSNGSGSSATTSPLSSAVDDDHLLRGGSVPSLTMSSHSSSTSLSIHDDVVAEEKAAAQKKRASPSASLAHARSLIEHQAASLLYAARRMREEEETIAEFELAQSLVVDTLRGGGKLVWTGVGKSGIIARKLCSTSLSLGMPSTYLDPLSALHGDLGLLNGSKASGATSSLLPTPPPDLVLALSHSGSSSELLALVPHLEIRGVKVVALTARRDSGLGQAAKAQGGAWLDCRTAGRRSGDEDEPQQDGGPKHNNRFPTTARDVFNSNSAGTECSCSTSALMGPLSGAPGTDEADLDLPAPSSSTTTALVMGDSLVLSCAKSLGLGVKHFGANHPGGSLGQRMMQELKEEQQQQQQQTEIRRREEQELQESKLRNGDELQPTSMQSTPVPPRWLMPPADELTPRVGV